MRYGQPSIGAELAALKASGVQRILVLPAYPQYSGTSTASVFDAVYTWAAKTRLIPELRFVNHYHDHPGYIAALAARVRAHWALHGRAEKLLMSFHGVPERTLHLGDPYHCECHKTARLLAEQLGLDKKHYLVTFQSRFGKAKWLEPYTEPTLVAQASAGLKPWTCCAPASPATALKLLRKLRRKPKKRSCMPAGKVSTTLPVSTTVPTGWPRSGISPSSICRAGPPAARPTHNCWPRQNRRHWQWVRGNKPLLQFFFSAACT